MKQNIVCEDCNNNFVKPKSKKRMYPKKCRSCINRLVNNEYNKMSQLPVGKIDKVNFQAYDINGNRIAVKRKFNWPCDKCGTEYKAAMIFEKKKKHPFHCKGCAIHLEWQNKEYYESHKEKLSALWDDPEYRAKARIRPNSPWSKGGWYNKIWYRSQMEIKFAKALDSKNIGFKYEPERIILENGSGYLPDFYIPEIDCWVELKGKNIPDEKYYMWKQQSNVNSCILFYNNINEFKRSKDGTNYIKKKCGL